MCLPLLAAEPDHLIEERGHGRINRWSTWTTTAAGIDFPYAAQLGCIRRDVFDLDGVAISKEIALAVTSSPANRTSPADLHTHVRQHWGIEVRHEVALCKRVSRMEGRACSTVSSE